MKMQSMIFAIIISLFLFSACQPATTLIESTNMPKTTSPEPTKSPPEKTPVVYQPSTTLHLMGIGFFTSITSRKVKTTCGLRRTSMIQTG